MFIGPLFIVGAPRSGTKLFRDLLRQHPRVAIPLYETELLPRLIQIAPRFGDLAEPANFQRMYAWASRQMYFRYMADDGALITWEAWHKSCRAYDVAGVFEGLVRHDAPAPWGSDVIWGDKSPNYRMHVPALAKLYPTARFIHLIRDARDVCLSSYKAWGKNILRNAQRWADEVALCRRDCAALGAERAMELRYEDLIADVEGQQRRVSAFLGLPFDAAMTRPGRVSENLGDTKGADRVVAGNSEKWRELPEATLRRVEALAGAQLQSLGYTLALPPQPPARLSAAEQQALRAADGVNLLRFRVKEWGWRDAVKYSLAAWESTRA